jgi:AcrR family transcriptional regulator
MIYHYFGNKDEIYLAVLEEVLAALRHDELQHDTEVEDPVQGLLDVFDQIDRHFATHPRLRQILAFENLNQARHLMRSERIREMAWPVLQRVRRLLAQGVKAGVVRSGIEPLHLYVAMASLAYYGRSHAYTLSRMFRQDMLKPAWQRAHREQTRQMLLAYLAPPPS